MRLAISTAFLFHPTTTGVPHYKDGFPFPDEKEGKQMNTTIGNACHQAQINRLPQDFKSRSPEKPPPAEEYEVLDHAEPPFFHKARVDRPEIMSLQAGKVITSQHTVLIAQIDSMTRWKGRGCYASNAHLAAVMGVSPRCVQKWLNHLIETELVTVTGYIKVRGRNGTIQTRRVMETRWAPEVPRHPTNKWAETATHKPTPHERTFVLYSYPSLHSSEKGISGDAGAASPLAARPPESALQAMRDRVRKPLPREEAEPCGLRPPNEPARSQARQEPAQPEPEQTSRLAQDRPPPQTRPVETTPSPVRASPAERNGVSADNTTNNPRRERDVYAALNLPHSISPRNKPAKDPIDCVRARRLMAACAANGVVISRSDRRWEVPLGVLRRKLGDNHARIDAVLAMMEVEFPQRPKICDGKQFLDRWNWLWDVYTRYLDSKAAKEFVLNPESKAVYQRLLDCVGITKALSLEQLPRVVQEGRDLFLPFGHACRKFANAHKRAPDNLTSSMQSVAKAFADEYAGNDEFLYYHWFRRFEFMHERHGDTWQGDLAKFRVTADTVSKWGREMALKAVGDAKFWDLLVERMRAENLL